MGEPSSDTPPSVSPPEDRLDSWKEIAGYLNRDVTTVQRWEKREGMPVHRHLHDRLGSVFASRTELDSWARSRNLRAAAENLNDTPSPNLPAQPPQPAISTTAFGIPSWSRRSPWSWDCCFCRKPSSGPSTPREIIVRR